jgi:hypothetical protein
VGKRIDEAEKDLISIAHSHWVDTATGVDLDQLGALYNIKRKPFEPDLDYRNKLKASIISYKGGGTVEAIKAVIRIALRLPQDYPVEIVENPAVDLKRTWKVKAGQEWMINPRSIYETIPKIIIAVDTENGKITDPILTNLATGESIVYKGDMFKGDELKIDGDKAYLNGEDCSAKLSVKKLPRLPRGRSRWKYEEYLGENKGIFDQSQFDRSVFVLDTTSSITFQWTANLPATFELKLPKEVLDRAGVSVEYVQDLLDSAKACGVRGDVKVI